MRQTFRTRRYRGTPANLRRLAASLKRGRLVAVPTETVYGLAGDATNPDACRAIFKAKGRPANDPLIVHVHAWRQVAEVAHPNAAAERLAKAFWPGPLTLVLPKQDLIPDVVTAGGDSVAVRMPAHPLFRRLLKLSGRPLAAPSANLFGYVSPTTAEHVAEGLSGRIPAILDGGPCPIGVESTIVDLRDPQRPRVLRPGAITAEEISRVLDIPVSSRRRTIAAHAAAAAPGMLTRHYSPRTPVVLHERLPRHTPAGEARVAFGPSRRTGEASTHVLSPDGRGETAARRLFAVLRELDAGQWKRLHIERAPAEDPWADALNDRLQRAAARR